MLLSRIGREASWSMRNIENFPQSRYVSISHWSRESSAGLTLDKWQYGLVRLTYFHHNLERNRGVLTIEKKSGILIYLEHTAAAMARMSRLSWVCWLALQRFDFVISLFFPQQPVSVTEKKQWFTWNLRFFRVRWPIVINNDQPIPFGAPPSEKMSPQLSGLDSLVHTSALRIKVKHYTSAIFSFACYCSHIIGTY